NKEYDKYYLNNYIRLERKLEQNRSKLLVMDTDTNNIRNAQKRSFKHKNQQQDRQSKQSEGLEAGDKCSSQVNTDLSDAEEDEDWGDWVQETEDRNLNIHC